MKRRKLLGHLQTHKCSLRYEGKKHSIYYNPKNDRTSTVPRHQEIDDLLANKICRDLGVQEIKK